MLKEVKFDQTWVYKVDDETTFTCRPFGGALTTQSLDKGYFQKCIIEATGFEYRGKDIKHWSKRTGVAKYMNGKEAHVGDIPFDLILPPKVATPLLTQIMERSILEDGETKN